MLLTHYGPNRCLKRRKPSINGGISSRNKSHSTKEAELKNLSTGIMVSIYLGFWGNWLGLIQILISIIQPTPVTTPKAQSDLHEHRKLSKRLLLLSNLEGMRLPQPFAEPSSIGIRRNSPTIDDKLHILPRFFSRPAESRSVPWWSPLHLKFLPIKVNKASLRVAIHAPFFLDDCCLSPYAFGRLKAISPSLFQ